MQPDRKDRDRPLAVVAFAGSALLLTFWVLYVSGALTLGEPGSIVRDYEAAFPAADALIALLLLGAGVGLWRGHGAGRILMTAASSMVVYLGVLDLTFYSRQGLFTMNSAESGLELALISTCLLGGGFALLRTWRHGRTS